MTRTTIVLFAAATLFATACKKKGDDAAGSSAAKPTEAAKGTAMKLPKVGLQIDITGDTAMVSDGMSDKSNMIMGGDVGALNIELADKAETLDEAKDEAKDFNPKDLKDEKLADGWAVTYSNTGSMGANYFVTVFRTIGGKNVKCSTTVSKPEQAQAALAACKTLRP